MVSIFIRSLLFNVGFYLSLAVHMVPATLTFVLPRQALFMLAKSWAHSMIWMLRVFCNIHVEFRGVDKIPKGPLLVAAKHQSAFETIAPVAAVPPAAVHPQARADLDSPVRSVPAEGADDPGQSRRRRAHLVEDDRTRARARARRPPADHLSGRHAPSRGRRAALQIRRGAGLCRLRRAVPAGGAQLRPVLAAPHVHALSRNDRRRVSRRHSAGPVARRASSSRPRT